jgi:hypothetical protein
MRASDALMLGSTILRPLRGIMNDMNQKGESGCALGMIEKGGMLSLQPWMFETMVEHPCGCSASRICVASAIAHLFDFHTPYPFVASIWTQQSAGVTAISTDWTIDRIADWLRTIEPTEEIENANEDKSENGSKEETQSRENVCQ